MKKSLIIILLSLMMVPVFAQEEQKIKKVQNEQEDTPIRTLFNSGNKKVSHGGYGALIFGVDIKGPETILSYGIKSGWMINHHVTIGIEGKGFASVDKYTFNDVIGEYNISGGYGGLLVEPVIAPFAPVHVSFPIVIGAGGICYVDNDSFDDDGDFDHDDYDTDIYDQAAFFVFEPGVELEINLLKFMRLGVGVSYRYTSDIKMAHTDKDLMRGFSGNIALKFGKF